MKATALIAEDEEPQRRELRRLLASLWPELEIVAECEDGLSALEALQAQQPQIVFLDIRMPGLSGIEVARQACSTAQVVMTTAYDAHAVQAFEAGAVDYLLKPITPERLARTIERLKSRLEAGNRPDIAAVLDSIQRLAGGTERPRHLRWITATVGNLVKMFAVEDILFFMSDDKYTRVVSRDEEAVIRTPLKELLQELDPDAFWQIHRSVIVQVRAIRSVRRNDLGRLELSVEGSPEALPVSQAFQHRFKGM